MKKLTPIESAVVADICDQIAAAGIVADERGIPFVAVQLGLDDWANLCVAVCFGLDAMSPTCQQAACIRLKASFTTTR